MSRLIPLAVVALVAVLTIAACDAGADSGDPGAYTVGPERAVGMIERGERTVIDVRTPAEYAEAHVLGALNIDVESDSFDALIADLDPDEAYLVYCRSGRRSAIAADTMEKVGFTDVADAGGLVDLVRAGAPIE